MLNNLVIFGIIFSRFRRLCDQLKASGVSRLTISGPAVPNLEYTKMAAGIGAKQPQVVALCADFLSLDPQDPKFYSVESILLDPSCSGSGLSIRQPDGSFPSSSSTNISSQTAGSRDFVGEESSGRLKRLANLQAQLLRHALSFPSVNRVVYSTCSVHSEVGVYDELCENSSSAMGDVRRSCPLSPLLFDFVMDEVMEDCLRYSQVAGVHLLPGRILTDFDYADDKVLLFDTFQAAQAMLLSPRVNLPCYARVNGLHSHLELIRPELLAQGYEEVQYDRTKISYRRFLKQVRKLQANQFLLDYHLPDDLLVFPPGTCLLKLPSFISHGLLIQDKASCIPTEILLSNPDGDVIDACAAPGNKTLQLIPMLSSKATLFAIDRDPSRKEAAKCFQYPDATVRMEVSRYSYAHLTGFIQQEFR
ncbi:25S rRNA (cytosine2278-C5)-methyltransferase [Paragonimus westermani]|uniref:25S rRNA (Cytosine2278-C5)-methyltransferase n=1 Tax=Paragonimus westermani TaxID=34504 RepID=A0A5J4N745_9TREM|nr:25S rRNA (cytosine2278-C5)-methyltransferase [Paragonimus westermani]